MYFLNIPNLFDEEEFKSFLDTYWPQIFILNNDRNIVLASTDRVVLVEVVVAVRALKSYKGTPLDIKMITEEL